jgi:hypothetical protein
MHFISHSSLDKTSAVDLRDRLLARGYDSQQIFLDSDEDSGIAAGQKWEQVLYERLKDCRALIVLCSPHWQQSKWCFAELVYAKMAGKEVFPVVLADCDLSVASEHQAVFVNKEGEAAYARLLDTLEARHLGPKDHLPWPHPDLRDIHGRPDDCPFPGLPAFDERYAAVYFGRERETQVVLEELRQMRTKGEPRLLMIVGGSGSGKSSLLMAGVLPRLNVAFRSAKGRSFAERKTTNWLVLPTLRFGRRDYPDALFESLAEEIVAHYPSDAAAQGITVPDRKTLRDQFAADDAAQAAEAFLDAARDLTFACGCKDATVLLPVDQFEEFLPPSGGANGTKFLKFLEQVCQYHDNRLLVIGTMRSDYLDVYERHPHALKAPTFYPWRLEPFPREQIANVIVKPAARAHVEVTPELLEQLKQETPTTDALPLLAFTLEKLYRAHAADKQLDLSEYKSLGGMEGSIKHTAKQIMRANPLPPNVESAVRLSFVKHLAQVNEKGEFVCRSARWSQLPEAAKPLLEQFVRERLLHRSGGAGELIEVSHEALFRSWDLLTRWLNESSRILRWCRDVEHDRKALEERGDTAQRSLAPRLSEKWRSILGKPRSPPNQVSPPYPPPSSPRQGEHERKNDVFLGAASPRAVAPGTEFVARFAAYVESCRPHVEDVFEKEAPTAAMFLDLTSCQWKVGAKVSVRLSSRFLKVYTPVQDFIWRGQWAMLRFDVEVPTTCPFGITLLKFDVSVQGTPVITLRPEIEVKHTTAEKEKESIHTETPAPRTAFASYAKPDRRSVLERVRSLQTFAGIDVFVDCLSIRPGERWKPEIQKQIRSRDTFLLFWSRNASNSQWVDWEWRIALDAKTLKGIQPHPLEPSEIAPPPPELGELQFGSVYEWYLLTLRPTLLVRLRESVRKVFYQISRVWRAT